MTMTKQDFIELADFTFIKSKVVPNVMLVTPITDAANKYMRKWYASSGYNNWQTVGMEEDSFMAFNMGCMSNGLNLQAEDK